MAAESEAGSRFAGGTGLWLRRQKGRAFEALLIGTTLVGVASLVVLFGYISLDALGPFAASPSWYLVYFATLVGPTAAYTLYVRDRPAARLVNGRMYGAVVGGGALGLSVYVVASALSPYDVGIFVVAAGVPAVAVAAYDRYTRTYWAGPAVPVLAVAGGVCGIALRNAVRPAVESLPQWVPYLTFTALPAAGVAGVLVTRRTDRRSGALAAGATLIGAGVVIAGAPLVGEGPELWITLYSYAVVPAGYVVAVALRDEDHDPVGVFGPVVLGAGVLAGAAVERRVGIEGLDSWVTPTLLTDSWSSTFARQAGVYPQIVGSIIIVSAMAVMTFPIGVGAAIYLEEYASSTGLRGRFFSLIEVNVANLAGVPSVVYGLLGLTVFGGWLDFEPGLVFTGAATLGMLILPIVIVSAREAIRAVPDSHRMGSYGMGASRWQTLRRVVLPEAFPGILTGTILAIGRAIGETAPLIVVAVSTTTYSPPAGLFDPGTALPLQIFSSAAKAQPAFRTGVVAAASLVLLALLLFMNGAAIVLRNRYDTDD